MCASFEKNAAVATSFGSCLPLVVVLNEYTSCNKIARIDWQRRDQAAGAECERAAIPPPLDERVNVSNPMRGLVLETLSQSVCPGFSAPVSDK
mmetsp:Transcript_22331/g.29752  ORF Transcript_22331/g.29752 Transcript_22331/m.29752 type:complete len:93 (-) Transcript_22331:831-1109(-)